MLAFLATSYILVIVGYSAVTASNPLVLRFEQRTITALDNNHFLIRSFCERQGNVNSRNSFIKTESEEDMTNYCC
jgi:hypothetical protein